MNDILVENLSREQIENLSKILEVCGVPATLDDIPPVVMTLQAAMRWYQVTQERMRLER